MSKLEIIRGDTHNFKFLRKNKDGDIMTKKPDRLFFSVKKDYYEKECRLQKQLDEGISYSDTDNYYRFTIEPKDTNNLDYGDYVYDIEVIEKDKVKTIAKGALKITEEVTFAENEV